MEGFCILTARGRNMRNNVHAATRIFKITNLNNCRTNSFKKNRLIKS